MIKVGDELAVRAYEQGFHAGTDPRRGRSRHAVDPVTHDHWRAGFEAGRAALDKAASDYRARFRR